MVVCIPVCAAAVTTPAERALLFRALLEPVIFQNRLLVRRGLVPRLYESRVRYREEPWQGRGLEEFAPANIVMQRGWGDCDDLAAWRAAELREAGDLRAGVKIYWRLDPQGNARLYHAETRHGDGRVEDPSRLLGMGACAG